MTEYNFVLRFKLSEIDRDPDDLIERLGEAGCTDATVGIGCAGIIALDFRREADNAANAIATGLADVLRAIPDATLIEASPDLVGITDVADQMGVARQSIRKLWVTNDDFPCPVYSGTTSLWHLRDVLVWFEGRDGYNPDKSMIDIATATLSLNLTRETKRPYLMTSIFY